MFTWTKYVGCDAARSFVNPLTSGDEGYDEDTRAPTADIRGFLQKSGRSGNENQFGKDFSGRTVGSKEGWLAAVNELRSSPKGQGQFWDWLHSKESVDWRSMLAHLDDHGTNPQNGQVGSHDYYIRRLKDEGYRVMALWDIRCRNLEYTSVIPSTPEYWMERWETYRWFYIGGRWFAERGVDDVELYNEPDKDKKDRGCTDGLRLKDDIRIRSQAMQDAYEDETNGQQKPNIVAGTLTIAWRSEFSTPLTQNWFTPFPDPAPTDDFFNTRDPEDGSDSYEDPYGGGDDGYQPEDAYPSVPTGPFQVAKAYSLHDYGSFSANSCTEYSATCRHENGYATRKQYNTAKTRLREKNLGNVPVYITEMNAYTAGQSDKRGHAYFEGKHVADYSATATSLASQFSAFSRFADGPNYVNVHKLVQTRHRTMPSRIAKNGVLYADTEGPPFHVSSSTKSAEALKQFCTKARGGNAVYGVSSYDGKDPNYRTNRFNVWWTKTDNKAYIFAINDNWEDTSAQIDVSVLNPDPSTSYTITSISDSAPFGSTHHGEVSQTGQLIDGNHVEFGIPSQSIHVVTVPIVPTQRASIVADRDATIQAEGMANGGETSLRVKTNGKDSSIAMINFNTEGKVGDIGIVNAVLELNLERATNNNPQVLAVIGWNRGWDEDTPDWNGISLLNRVNGDIRRTKDNFINWNDAIIVGHVTVPPGNQVPGGGMKIRLDVTDTIGRVSNYAIVRMFRMDQSTGEPPAQLPADTLEGEYYFTSRESSNEGARPTLLVDYQVSE